MNSQDLKAEIAKAVAEFQAYNEKIQNDLEKTILEAALIVERDAKESFKGRDAPSVYNEPPRVDTGRLRASITHRGGRDSEGEYYQEVGTNVEYAADVELGTSETMPHPYLTYSLEMNRYDIEAMIAEAVKDAGH